MSLRQLTSIVARPTAAVLAVGLATISCSSGGAKTIVGAVTPPVEVIGLTITGCQHSSAALSASVRLNNRDSIARDVSFSVNFGDGRANVVVPDDALVMAGQTSSVIVTTTDSRVTKSSGSTCRLAEVSSSHPVIGGPVTVPPPPTAKQ